jgi:hypothetical protein
MIFGQSSESYGETTTVHTIDEVRTIDGVAPGRRRAHFRAPQP